MDIVIVCHKKDIILGKIICIDSATLFFPCVFAWERQIQLKEQGKIDFVPPVHYIYFNTIISCLKKIGVDKEDKVFITLEGKSWRKKYDSNYKAQRQEQRESHKLINWDKEFATLNKLHNQLDQATTWRFTRHWDLESDDLCAIASRVFKDKSIIIVTGDSDLNQLCYYDNVHIFNVNKKCNGTKGMYIVENKPLQIIAKKVRLGDVSDNILVSPNDIEEEMELRNLLVNLIDLPKEIEEKGRQAIQEALSVEKEENLNLLPNFKNVKEKFLSIYKKDKVITFDYCKQLLEKRDKRKKEKAKQKRLGRG